VSDADEILSLLGPYTMCIVK